MTQRELSYVEDAIGHEQNIIAVVEDTISRLEDANLKSFMEEELNTHKTMEENLINLLEGKVNE